MNSKKTLLASLMLVAACGTPAQNPDGSTSPDVVATDSTAPTDSAAPDAVTPDASPADAPAPDVNTPDAAAPDSAPADATAADGGLVAPTVPDAIRVPDATLSPIFAAFGMGVQIYVCTAMTAGDGGTSDAAATSYSWVFTAPEATLYDLHDHTMAVGMHGAGPFWQTTDGSRVVGTRIASANSPLTTAIPWLLLSGGMRTGTGPLSRAQFVQRVNTAGGVAPSTACDASNAGAMSRVDYTADYYFFGAP